MTTPPPGMSGSADAGTGGYERAQASHLQRQVAEGFGAELLDGLGSAIDAAGGAFTMSYTTIAATAARLAS